ncbi:MAG: hypothetical protein J1F14_06470 [Treponema sp.]|nr:hypothetical protein [Treponema sp.]
MDCVLCADIGSSSLKAALINADGKVLAYSKQSLGTGDSDRAAEEWEAVLGRAVTDISQSSPCKAQALCISGNGPTVVSDTGETLLWSRRIDEEHGASLFIPRLKAFRKIYPQAWSRSRYVFSGPEFLIWRLTGTPCTILPEKRFLPAYWSDGALEDAGFSSVERGKLPPFLFPSNLAGTVKSGFTGIADGTPVYCGAPDFVSALVGTGTLKPGLLCDRAGSSEGINLCTDFPLKADGIRTLPSVIPGLWNAGALIKESGSRFIEYKKRTETATGRAVNFTDLVHGSLYGGKEFSEGMEILGSLADNVRSAVETLRTAWSASCGKPFPESMTVTGGQAANPEWSQFKADVTGLCINVMEIPDAELAGDAVMAFTGAGHFSSLTHAAESLCRVRRSFVPRKGGAAP